MNRAEFSGTDRFEVVRKLGAGGMGDVYEALDRERNVRIALKTLRGLSGEDVLDFKREFRTLQDVQHPNLISLGELYEDRGRWFFTMELVRGAELMSYVRADTGVDSGVQATLPLVGRALVEDPTMPLPDSTRRRVEPNDAPLLTDALIGAPPTLDEERARAALVQLAQALVWLHTAGKVHRDIKPSNILVTPDGRLVVLDFGLVVDVARGGNDGRLAGTVPYIAPESLFGAVGPASDWYAVGVVLYEMMTGRLPFSGSISEMLSQKRNGTPPPPRSVAPEASAELSALCTELLDPDPKKRPTGTDVLARLARRRAHSIAPYASLRAPFVGRERELNELRAGYAASLSGGTVAVFVRGESGIGKSALVKRFVEELGDEVTILSGRCYEREAVRYKAVDGVIDALSQLLRRMIPDDVAGLFPNDGGLLSQVFPVLHRIDPLAGSTIPPPMEPHVARAHAFAALKELLFRLASRKPLVVTIDDVQWADADGSALLAEMVRAPLAPPMLLVATCRGESALDLPCDMRRIDLEGLSEDDAISLATQLVERTGGRVDPVRVATEAHGHPMFIDELARHARSEASRRTWTAETEDSVVKLDDAIRSRVAALPPDARGLLEVLCVAGAPVAESVAANAALDVPDEFHRCLALLRGAHLVRSTAQRGEVAIETVHDRVREAVLSGLSDETRRGRAARMAKALEARGGAEPAALSSLYRTSGNLALAATYAERAAERAMFALAFDRATFLYRQAIEMGGANLDRLRGLADALAYAGRGREAAAAYKDAAARAEGAEARRLHRRTADELLRSGHIDEGLAALDSVLRDVGSRMPRTNAGALASLLVHRGSWAVRSKLAAARVPFVRGKSAENEAFLAQRFDAAWSVAIGLSLVDQVRAADFQAQAALLAERMEDDERLARAYALGSGFASGESTGPRARVLLTRATDLAARTEDRYTHALLPLARAMISFHEGRFRTALDDADRALRLFRDECTGTSWEQTSARCVGFWALGYLGSMRELTGRVEELLRESIERGDRYAAINVRVGAAHLVRLAQDDPASSRAESARAIAEWSQRGFTLQHLLDLFAQVETLLYEERIDEAHDLLASRWGLVRRSLMLRSPTARIFTTDLRGRIELARAAHAGIVKRRLAARRALALSAALDGEGLAWAMALAEGLRAGAAALFDRGDSTVRALERAARAFRAADMGANVAAVEHALARARGDRALGARADAWMENEGIVNIARWSRMLMPLA